MYYSLDLVNHFKFGNQKILRSLNHSQEKSFPNRSNLKWENKQKGTVMTINVGGGELRELKPRILVIGVGGKEEMQSMR